MREILTLKDVEALFSPEGVLKANGIPSATVISISMLYF